MAIHHATSGEPVNVQPLGERLSTDKTIALFKSSDLEVIRLVLLAGKSMPVHQVAGEITLQCLEGRLEVMADGQGCALEAGHLLFLAAGVPHSVTALQDASALLTLVVRK